MGKVYLVGAGPGDFDLISLKALEIIKKADCIIFDGLISPFLLIFSKEKSKWIYVGKSSKNHEFSQIEINKIIYNEAIKKKIVVRLKGGDPFIFGRGGEELFYLNNKKIDVEVVPGITSGVAIASLFKIPLTHRNFASEVIFLTGHRKQGEKIDYKHLAKFKGTIVIYMGVEEMKKIVENLIRQGKNPYTPATAASAFIDGNWIKKGYMQDLDKMLEDKKSPAVAIIGKAAGAASEIKNDFPLANRIVALTQPLPDILNWARDIKNLGGIPVPFPTIRFEQDFKNLSKLKNKKFNWIIFTSKRAVEFLKVFLMKKNKTLKFPNNSKICAIGKSTSKEIKEIFAIKPDIVPRDYTQEGIVREFKKRKIKNKSILILSGYGRDVLKIGLQKLKNRVEEAKIYKTKSFNKNKLKILFRFLKKADSIIFSAPSTFNNFISFGKSRNLLEKMKIIAIGPVTKDAIENEGFKVSITPKEYTRDGTMMELKKWNR